MIGIEGRLSHKSNFTRLKSLILKGIASIAYEEKISVFQSITIIILIFIEDLSLVFNPLLALKDNESIFSPAEQFIEYLSIIPMLIRKELYNYLFVIFIVAFALTILLLIAFILICLQNRKNILFNLLNKYFFIYDILVLKIFFSPLILANSYFIRQWIKRENNINMFASSSTLIPLLSIISLLLLFLVNYFKTKGLYLGYPSETNVETIISPNNNILFTEGKMIIMLLIILDIYYQFIGIIIAIFGILQFQNTFKQLYYHNEYTEQAKRLEISATSFTYITLFFSYILSIPSIILFFFLFPCIFFMTFGNFVNRMDTFSSSNNNASIANLIGNLTWIYNLIKNNDRQHELIQRGFIYAHLNDFYHSGKFSNAKTEDELDQLGSQLSIEDLKNILLKYCEAQYLRGISLNPNSQYLKISFAYFLYFNLNREHGIYYLNELEKAKLSYEETIQQILLRKIVDNDVKNMKQLSQNSSIGIKLIEYESLEKIFINEMEESAICHYQFYSCLVQQSPDPSKLAKAGFKVIDARLTVEKIWDGLQKLISYKVDSSFNYSNYLKKVMWDEELSKMIYERANESIQALLMYNSFQDISENIEFSESPILKLKITENSKASITQINNSFSSEYGFTKNELIGKSLKMLIPKCFFDLHEKLMETHFKSLDGKERNYKGSDILIPIINKMDYVIPSIKFILKVPNLIDGPYYIAKFFVEKSNHIFDLTYILTDQNFSILNVSSTSVSNCNLSQEIVMKLKPNLIDFIPKLQNSNDLKSTLTNEGIVTNFLLPEYNLKIENYEIDESEKLIQNEIQIEKKVTKKIRINCKIIKNDVFKYFFYLFKLKFLKESPESDISCLEKGNDNYNQINYDEKFNQYQLSPYKIIKESEELKINCVQKEVLKLEQRENEEEKQQISMLRQNSNEQNKTNLDNETNFSFIHINKLKDLIKLRNDIPDANIKKLIEKEPINFSFNIKTYQFSWENPGTFIEIMQKKQSKLNEIEDQILNSKENQSESKEKDKLTSNKKKEITDQGKNMLKSKLENSGKSFEIRLIYIMAYAFFLLLLFFPIFDGLTFINKLNKPIENINKYFYFTNLLDNIFYSFIVIDPFYYYSIKKLVINPTNNTIISELFQINILNLKLINNVLSYHLDFNECPEINILPGSMQNISFDFITEVNQIQGLQMNLISEISNPNIIELETIIKIILEEISIMNDCYFENLGNIMSNDIQAFNNQYIIMIIGIIIIFLVISIIIFICILIYRKIENIMMLFLQFSVASFEELRNSSEDYLLSMREKEIIGSENTQDQFSEFKELSSELTGAFNRSYKGNTRSKFKIIFFLISILSLFEIFYISFILVNRKDFANFTSILLLSNKIAILINNYALTLTYFTSYINDPSKLIYNQEPETLFSRGLSEGFNLTKSYENILISSLNIAGVKEQISNDACNNYSQCFKAKDKCYEKLGNSTSPNFLFLLSFAYREIQLNFNEWKKQTRNPPNLTLADSIYISQNLTFRCLLEPQINTIIENLRNLISTLFNDIKNDIVIFLALICTFAAISFVLSQFILIPHLQDDFKKIHMLIGILPFEMSLKNYLIKSYFFKSTR